MGIYDSSRFSREFSERTKKNLEYITRAVESDALDIEFRKSMIKAYQDIIDYINNETRSLHKEIGTLPNLRNKGESKMRRDLHSLVSRIESNKRILEGKLNTLARDVSKPDAELYEVTQLLNSLMGIAVLPYEMHKRCFKENIDEDDRPVQNWGRTLSEIQDSIKAEPEYQQLKEYILELHDEGKWATTYTKDLIDNQINKDVVVFAFLRHLRNAVCHSGNNSISILPLTEGRVIEEVLFYDSYSDDSNRNKKDKKNRREEFAMRLSVKELRLLVEKVAMFYSDTSIGEINTTKSIKNVEDKIKKLLIKA